MSKEIKDTRTPHMTNLHMKILLLLLLANTLKVLHHHIKELRLTKLELLRIWEDVVVALKLVIY